MTAPIERIVIVGAGECGGRAAVTLRESGFEGTIALIGDEAHLPYERPPLSKAALTDPDEPRPVPACSQEQIDRHALTFIGSSPVARLDRQERTVVLADGRAVPYDRLIVTTGARARTLTVDGGDHAVTLRSFADSTRLRAILQPGARVGVVGAGFIGLEVAASARRRGCAVTVLEMAPRVMGRAVPAEVAAVVAARHVAAGVDLRCGVRIERIAECNGAKVIVLADDEPVECDVVVAGVGATPNTELAVAAGLEVDNGISVDECLRTPDPLVFAAGDCCSFPHSIYGARRIRLESWRNAQDQGAHVARSVLGDDAAFTTIPWFWSDQYELGLQIAGLPDAAAAEVVRFRADGIAIRFGLDGDGRLVAASGVAVGAAVAKDIRLAEMLIAKRATPTPAQLADPTVSLKSLLKA